MSGFRRASTSAGSPVSIWCSAQAGLRDREAAGRRRGPPRPGPKARPRPRGRRIRLQRGAEAGQGPVTFRSGRGHLGEGGDGLGAASAVAGPRRVRDPHGEELGGVVRLLLGLVPAPHLPARDSGDDQHRRRHDQPAIAAQQSLGSIRPQFLVDFVEDVRHVTSLKIAPSAGASGRGGTIATPAPAGKPVG